MIEYRWRCPCGRVGSWVAGINQAVGTGAHHVCEQHGKGAALPLESREVADRDGLGLADALMAHRTLKAYELRHGSRRVDGAWLKIRYADPISRSDKQTYLLLDRTEEHFYVKRQALGVDSRVLEDAIRRGASSVVIVYRGRTGRTVYRASVETWRGASFRVSYPDFDEQTQLPIREMEILARDGITSWGDLVANSLTAGRVQDTGAAGPTRS